MRKSVTLRIIRKFIKSPSLETFWAMTEFANSENAWGEWYNLVCSKRCRTCPLFIPTEYGDTCDIMQAEELDDTFKDYWEKHQGEIVIQFVRLLERLRETDA